MAMERQPFLHCEQDFADAEQADHGHQKMHTAIQLGQSKGHPKLAGDRIHPDAGEQEAQYEGNHNLVALLAAEPDK